MVGIVSVLVYSLYCIVVDYAVYIAIDSFLYKCAIAKTSSRLVQRNLWLQEAMTTLCAAFLLHIISHTPRLLYCLSLFTGLYGLSRSFITLSEVYLALYRLCYAISLTCDHAALWFHRWRRRRFLNKQHRSTLANNVDDSHLQVHHVPLSVARIAQQRFKSPRIAGQLLFASPLLHECTTTPLQVVQRNSLAQKTSLSVIKKLPLIGETGKCNWLLRKPLDKVKVQLKDELESQSPSATSTFAKMRNAILGTDCNRITIIKNRIGKRLIEGVSGYIQNLQPNSLPSGLSNNGENVSFLNCILQVLRQTPGVAQLCHDSKAWLVNKNRSMSHEELLHSLRALLNSSNVGSDCLQSMNTTALRQSAARLCSFFVSSDATVPQCQQDAALFFEWLLEVTQDAIAAPNNGTSLSGIPAPRFWSRSLDVVSKDYGRATGASACVMSPARMTRLASAARNQLLYCSAASSLSELLHSASTVQLMRRIADLDWWLTMSSRTATDAICLARFFEGQLMNASICLTCRQVRVETKPFRLFSVALPRNRSTAVTLMECLTQSVGCLERLTGIVCEQCLATNKSLAVVNVASTTLSPIVGIPSSLMAGTTTSTPLSYGMSLHGNNTSTPTAALPQSVVTPHQRMLFIVRAPPILAVHLKRFGSEAGRVNTCVLLPQELKLQEMCLDDEAFMDESYGLMKSRCTLPVVYTLYGCVLHKSTGDGGNKGLDGHYLTLCKMFDSKSNSNQQWIRCDDDSVRLIVSDEEAWREIRCNEGTSQVYLAFYTRS